MKKILVVATGTEVGKTFVTAALAAQLLAAGHSVKVAKPIITGWDDDAGNDTKELLAATGQAINQTNIHACSPWRFRHPLSPDMAARRERRDINFDEVVAFCNSLSGAEYVLVEGAGGVMSPMGENKTFLDLCAKLRCPVVLVAGTYLGSISHTLTALAVLQSKHVPVLSVILSESENAPVSNQEMARSLSKFTTVPLDILPRSQSWATAPDLTHIVKNDVKKIAGV